MQKVLDSTLYSNNFFFLIEKKHCYCNILKMDFILEFKFQALSSCHILDFSNMEQYLSILI